MKSIKKVIFLFVLISSFFESLNVLALNAECNTVEVSYNNDKNNYYFQAKQECHFKREELFNHEDFSDAYVKAISSQEQYSDLSLNTISLNETPWSFILPDAEYRDKNSTLITSTQNLKNKHGDTEVKGNHFLTSIDSTTFKTNYISAKITATGYAKATKSIKEESILAKADSDGFKLTLKRELHLERPFIAPHNLFVKGVEDGMKEDFHTLYDLHSSAINLMPITG